MLASAKILGYVELKVGTIDIEVPIRARETPPQSPSNPWPDLSPQANASSQSDTPLAMFEVEGDAYAIVVSSDSRSATMRAAVEEAAEDALRHLSRKLLN